MEKYVTQIQSKVQGEKSNGLGCGGGYGGKFILA